MAKIKKCSPNMICIETVSLTLIALFTITIGYLYYSDQRLRELKRRENDNTSTVYPVTTGIARRTDVFNDPYAPPLRNDGIYFRKDTIDIRGEPRLHVPINIETRGLPSDYSQMGILTSNTTNHMILPLMGRRHMSGRDKWQYYTISNSGNLNTKLPIRVNNKHCSSEYGCDQIMQGDTIFVEGYNEDFKVTVYENGLFHYLPM